MFSIFRRLRRLEDRVTELEVSRIAMKIKYRTLNDIIHNHYKESCNADKDRQIEAS